VADETGECVVPALADVVGSFLISEGGVVHVPHCGLVQRCDAAKPSDHSAATKARTPKGSCDAAN